MERNIHLLNNLKIFTFVLPSFSGVNGYLHLRIITATTTNLLTSYVCI